MAALAAHSERTLDYQRNGYGNRYGGGNRSGDIERVCREIDHLSEECQHMLDRMGGAGPGEAVRIPEGGRARPGDR
jgi:hypothetical protein